MSIQETSLNDLGIKVDPNLPSDPNEFCPHDPNKAYIEMPLNDNPDFYLVAFIGPHPDIEKDWEASREEGEYDLRKLDLYLGVIEEESERKRFKILREFPPVNLGSLHPTAYTVLLALAKKSRKDEAEKSMELLLSMLNGVSEGSVQ